MGIRFQLKRKPPYLIFFPNVMGSSSVCIYIFIKFFIFLHHNSCFFLFFFLSLGLTSSKFNLCSVSLDFKS